MNDREKPLLTPAEEAAFVMAIEALLKEFPCVGIHGELVRRSTAGRRK